MNKISFIYLILLSMALTDTYKEPAYELLNKDGAIEIRQYTDYVIARTSIENTSADEDNNLFRRLGGYIFGNNVDNASIPTATLYAPVVRASPASPPIIVF